MPEIVVLRGVAAIADYLGKRPREINHLIRQRKLPAFMAGGIPVATAGGLDEWKYLNARRNVLR